MNPSRLLLPLALLSSASAARQRAKAGKNAKGSRREPAMKNLSLNIVNQAFQQPFGPFFVMVHNSDATPLYVRGKPASEELALLAENGGPGPLVEYYTENSYGVKSVMGFDDGFPFFVGDEVSIDVEVTDEYPLVTIASMAINTNDCFVALNGVKVSDGMVIDAPGLDAGSEENNENCDSIPGPACSEVPGNERDGKGEGAVHVHRGVFGIGDLAEDQYDWRNPMMRVVVS